MLKSQNRKKVDQKPQILPTPESLDKSEDPTEESAEIEEKKPLRALVKLKTDPVRDSYQSSNQRKNFMPNTLEEESF